MKLAIMQPYFLPYIGYFQLIKAVDTFVIYDNIQYTKKGWINRNRFLQNGCDAYFTIPLEKDSDYLNVNERLISPAFNRIKLLNQIKAAYKKAPNYERTYKLFERVVMNVESNLFSYIYDSLDQVLSELQIKTKIIVSSEINIDHTLKSQDRVIAICKELNADTYINPIGGLEIYSKEEFERKSINLEFIKSKEIIYKQFDNKFVPWLSIIDLMMFNNHDYIQQALSKTGIVFSE